MDWHDLLSAFALYLILEGLLPFKSPQAFKHFVQAIARMPEQQIRIVGLVSIVSGVVLLFWVR